MPRKPKQDTAPEPEPGSPLYLISAMVDKATAMNTGLAEVSDEAKFSIGKQFVLESAMYMQVRDDYPQAPVSLCNVEYQVLSMALQMASMLVTINTETSEKGTAFARECLDELMDEIMDDPKHPLRSQVIPACISSIMEAARDALPHED